MTYPNIAAELARHHMTQDELAQYLHVCRKTVYNWQKNGKIPQSKLKRMATLFGVSADYLLSRTATNS